MIFISKKKIFNKQLKRGKFYSVEGHPGMVYKKNDNKNTYYAIVTGTSQARHMTKLTHPTDSSVSSSYVKNRPVKGRRKHFGSKELVGMRFHKDDKNLINTIKRRKPNRLK